MAALVTDILDRFRQLETDRAPWAQHWQEIARYALPDAERFDRMFDGRTGGTGVSALAIDTVVSEPVAARRSKEIFDMTSLWAIDRGANGMISLKTPETSIWHDIGSTDPFAVDPSDDERLFYQTIRDYLFKTRANPRSGFWVMHKAAVRSTWAFGVGVGFVEESQRGSAAPVNYCYVPLSENHLGDNFEGVIDTNYRLLTRSARQCVAKWGARMSPKVQAMATDPKQMDKPITILHAVYPRDEKGSYGNSNRDANWASCYVEVAEKNLVGESGYWEFPYIIHHWQRNAPGPYSSGPMALALSEVKSLNFLKKNELKAVAQWVDPPYATSDTKGLGRLNLNPRAPNPGYLDENGRLRVQPIITQQRPDFAQTVLETRRGDIRETLYISLWQAIINSPREQTAFEAMLRNQEKGELLGPIGAAMEPGLYWMVERELGILARKGAFETGSPLAPPESLRGRPFGVGQFTSPLDKLRRLPQLQGMTQYAQLLGQTAQFKPDVLDKVDWDAYADEAADILDVPQKVMARDEAVQQMRAGRQAAQNAQTAIAATTGAGQAAEAAGKGIDAVASSPAATEVLKNLAGVAGVPGG